MRTTTRIRVLARRLLRAAADLGAREIHFYVGLAIAAGGGVSLSASWTFVLIGGAIAAVGYWGTR